MKKITNFNYGFTLLELLIVVAIISILAMIAFLVINPLEMIRESRDANRLSDLASLQRAINLAVPEATASGVEVLCSGSSGKPTPGQVLCQGVSNSSDYNPKATNGTGWVKIDLASQSSVSFAVLPADPLNHDEYYYTYASDGKNWEITAKLESTKYNLKMIEDGGSDNSAYEVGTNLNLIKLAT